MTLPERLKEVLLGIVPGTNVDKLRDLYADDIVFRDPIQTVRGMDAFLAMNRRMIAKVSHLEWSIESMKGDDTEAFLEWKMRGATKLGFKMDLDGVTRARARDGKIYDHRDYWDLGELIASTFPHGQRILQAVRAPFA